MKKWELLSSKMAFDHRWYKVRQDTVKLPTGRILEDYFLGVRGRYVQMLPITDDGNIIMVRQYKHGASAITLELPAGMVEENEDVEVCARRELLEETGCEGRTWKRLAVTHENPSKSVNESFWYLVTDLEIKKDQHLDENEEIEVVQVSIQEALAKIQSGEIISGPSIGQIFLGLYELRKLQFI